MADFDSGVKEESSLTLREKIDEFLESLSIKWQEFLDWSDDKGIPLRKVSDFFEQKGIPPLPALIVLLLLIVAGIYVAFLSFSTPVSRTFEFTVKGIDNVPIEGAAVQLQFTDKDGTQSQNLVTGADGRAKFDKIPATSAKVTVNAPDHETTTREVSLKESENKKTFAISLTRNDNPLAAISVSITGPTSADITLLAGNSSIIEVQNATSGALFNVAFNSNYTIIASALGYRQEVKVIEIGVGNLNVPIRMFRDGETRTAPVYVRVYQEDGLTPVANATVKFINDFTGSQITSSTTGEDGSALPVEIEVGANVSINVIATNFLTWVRPSVTVNEPQVEIVARLTMRTAENSKNIVVKIIDDDGNEVTRPNVALYCGNVTEVKTPESGIAGFDVELGKTCLVAVSKDGYLPLQKEVTSATEQNFILHQASSANSGAITIITIDRNSNEVGGVSVALFLNGKQTGISKTTMLDGKARFESLPLGEANFKASNSEYQGEVNVNVTPSSETDETEQEVELILSPASGIVNVTVLDHFTRDAIENAVVQLTSAGNATSCTVKNNQCIAVIESGDVNVKVTASGFEQLTTKIAVVPGDNNAQVFELISSDVADSTELVFLGVFNDKNKRVSVLSPATRYTAKYLLKSPPSLEFTSCKAFIQVGEKDVDIESGAAAITSFSSDGGNAIGGIDYSIADYFEPVEQDAEYNVNTITNTSVSANGDLTPLPSTVGTSASLASSKFKWAEFSFDKFEGTKELKVQIETSAVQEANVELFHRTAYVVPVSSGSSEVYRNPEDAAAGVSKSPYLAQLSEADAILIHFEGKCSENACLELWFEGSTGKKSGFQQFEAVVPEMFKLNYRVLVPPQPLRGTNAEISLSLQTDSDAVQLGSGNGNSATAKVAPGGEGFFSLKAVKFSNDVSITFTTSGGASFEEDLHVVISNAGNQLKVKVEPQELIAFQDNKVKIEVTDSFGAKVVGARVIFAKGEVLEAQAEAQEEKPGEYTAEIAPSSFGDISYSVQAEGFRAKSGKIVSNAKQIISIDRTNVMSIAIDSFEETEGASFAITNLVPNKEVKVALTAFSNNAPKYSNVRLSGSTVKLKGGETKTISLLGKINDNVLSFASKPNVLREQYDGTINVNARVAGHSQRETVTFKATASLQQETFEQLVDFSADSLDFALDLPRKSRDSQKIKITNNAPRPVLVNQQNDLLGLYVKPASAVIPAGGSVEFTASASPSQLFMAQQCVFEDLSENGVIEFIAGFQGMTTVKNVAVTVATTSKMRCFVPGAMAVVLPFDSTFMFPPGTISAKTTAEDGSQAVRLPYSELVVFNPGAMVTDQRATVPAGSAIELAPQHISNGNNMFQVNFPFPAFISILPNAQQTTLPDGSIKFTLPTADVILPPGIQRAFTNSMSSPYDSFGGMNAFNSNPYGSSYNQYGANTYNNQYSVNSPFSSLTPRYGSFDPYSGYGSQQGYNQFASNFGTQYSYAIPQFTSIQIIQRLTPVGLAAGGEKFEIVYEDEVYIDLPLEAQAQQSGANVNIALQNCVQLTVKSKGSRQQITDILPSASGQFTITNARLAGKKVELSQGGKISLSPCNEVEQDEQLFQTQLRASTTFVLPPGTPDPRKSAMQSNFPNCVELVYKSDYKLGVTNVKKIQFPQTAKIKQPPLENGAQEVEVTGRERVGFLSCKSIFPSVSSFAGYGIEARTEDGSQLSFTFTEADIGKSPRTADQKICLINKRKEVVYPAGDSFIYRVSDSSVPRELFKLTPVTTHTQDKLSTSENNECNNKFSLSLSIPPETHDDKCIITPIEKIVEVKFKATDNSGWVGSVSLPVKISVLPGNKCSRDQEAQTSMAMRSFFVDYAYSNDNLNERTGRPFVFAFKGTGEDHERVLTLVNNHENAVSLTVAGSSAVNCQIPSSMAQGEAQAVFCTPQTTTNGEESFTITATDGTVVYTKTVRVNVYNGNSEIYKNSPWGEIAPQEIDTSTATTAQTKFADADEFGKTTIVTAAPAIAPVTQCAKHYCTYEQAQASFNAFIAELSTIAKEKADSDSRMLFCAPGGPGANYVKTTIIHLANTEQDFGEYVKRQPLTAQNVVYDVANVPILKGCGIYAIQARLDLGCSEGALGTVDTSKDKIQITGATPLASCPDNVANAPLLLAGKQDDFNIYLGRELGAGFNKGEGLSSFIGWFSLGPYQKGASKTDIATTNALLKTIYGRNTPKISYTLPEHYNLAHFCGKRAVEQITTILGPGTAIGIGAVLTGIGAPVAAKIFQGLGQAAVVCGLSIVGEGGSYLTTGGSYDSCPVLNGCVRAAVFGAVGGLIAPVGVAGTGGVGARVAAAGSSFRSAIPSIGGWVGYSTLAVAATYGVETWLGDGSPAIPPGAAGAAVYGAKQTIVPGSTGTAAAASKSLTVDSVLSEINSYEQLSQAGKFTNRGEQLVGALLKAEKRNAGEGVFKFAVSEIANQREVLPKELSFWTDIRNQYQLQRIVNELSGNTNALKASVTVTTLDRSFGKMTFGTELRNGVGIQEQTLREVYLKALAANGKDDKIVSVVKDAVAKRVASKQIYFTELMVGKDGKMTLGFVKDVNKALTELEEATKAALKPAAVSAAGTAVGTVATQTAAEKASTWSKIKGTAKKVARPAGGLLAQVATQLGLDVDVQPVEIKVPESAKNVLVVYHIENPITATTLPSIHKICWQNADGTCKSESFYLANLCDSSTDACLLNYKQVLQSNSFFLFAVINSPKLPAQLFFDSIMVPEERPLDSSILNGAYKVGDITREEVSQYISEDFEMDKGSESALKGIGKATKSGTVGGTAGGSSG
ncbi:MAG: carboxypeptidase-like regulatory domain-containing protein [Candidatus Micrarchaeota archaeon]